MTFAAPSAPRASSVTAYNRRARPPPSAYGRPHQVQDGPFADTQEHLGGYFMDEAASLDDALEWAARGPRASAGSLVEVRSVPPPPAFWPFNGASSVH